MDSSYLPAVSGHWSGNWYFKTATRQAPFMQLERCRNDRYYGAETAYWYWFGKFPRCGKSTLLFHSAAIKNCKVIYYPLTIYSNPVSAHHVKTSVTRTRGSHRNVAQESLAQLRALRHIEQPIYTVYYLQTADAFRKEYEVLLNRLYLQSEMWTSNVLAIPKVICLIDWLMINSICWRHSYIHTCFRFGYPVL